MSSPTSDPRPGDSRTVLIRKWLEQESARTTQLGSLLSALAGPPSPPPPLGPLNDGLLAYWAFDAIVGGNTFLDSVGGNTMIAPNGISVVPGGKYGNAAAFDSALSQYLVLETGDLSTFSIYPANSITVNLWIRTSTGCCGAPFSKRDYGLYHEILCYNMDNPTCAVYLDSDANSGIDFTGGVADAQLHMLTMRWDFATRVSDVFVDGVQYTPSPPIGGNPVQSTVPFTIGATDLNVGGDLFFHGEQSSFAIWGRPLSNSEIADVFASPHGYPY